VSCAAGLAGLEGMSDFLRKIDGPLGATLAGLYGRSETAALRHDQGNHGLSQGGHQFRQATLPLALAHARGHGGRRFRRLRLPDGGEVTAGAELAQSLRFASFISHLPLPEQFSLRSRNGSLRLFLSTTWTQSPKQKPNKIRQAATFFRAAICWPDSTNNMGRESLCSGRVMLLRIAFACNILCPARLVHRALWFGKETWLV
jgi:hypothetical protein